jgi:hypothetical protein
MPKRLPPRPILDLSDQERAVLLAALSAFEVGRTYAAELESKQTIGGRNRRADLFADARIAGRLSERLLV